MSKIIKLNESSFKKLLEYVGDEEALGRYDIAPDDYPNIPDDEGVSVNRKTMQSDDVVSYPLTDKDFEEEQFVGQEYFDPYGREKLGENNEHSLVYDEYKPLTELKNGVYEGYYYTYIFELKNGRKYKTNMGVRCSKEYCGGPKKYLINGDGNPHLIK